MSRAARVLAALPVFVVAGLAAYWAFFGLQHWLSYETGSENTAMPPHNYNFFSGFGSIILPPVLNGFAFAAVFWWHNQCGVHGCYWYARRATAAGERACWQHHPEKKVTAGDLRMRHHLYLGERPGDG